ncbi:Transcriptional activator FeaR [Actinomadura rubteroloni]|uniref:Transcriptional activator FeaR n=1 Tax=Actinomadura rubteroloni TaxID=1926885 RepID=A0A2P4UQU4_9ACTN|nr:AraC family transcriptional regulator [Actinomadura rubteroloni]POM27415.1 Transcriptional activator FeaR [Actinomadura rubteroloni]
MADVPRGVLYPDQHAPIVTVATYPPSTDLAACVEYYWHVRWEAAEPYETKVLSHPNIHLVFEEPVPLVYGVDRSVFTRRLTGTGHVLGVRFLPGGFHPLWPGPAADLTDRRVPASSLLGPAVDELNARVLADPADTSVVEDFLRPRLAAPRPPGAADAAEIVRRITADPSLVRVDRLAADLGVSVRTLQRLFADHVGVSPKWVLRRARLHEAAARAHAGTAVDWAALASDLGYSDQAHLTRDFTAAVGVPPGRYARA